MGAKEELLALKPEPPARIDLPEIAAPVYAKTFTAADQDAWEYELMTRQGPNDSFRMAGLRAMVIRIGACDESGAPLFGDADIAAINSLPTKVAGKIYEAIKSHNNLLAKDDDAEKN